MVKIVNNLNEIDKQQKTVIDFFAPWCGPCNRIAGDYEKLAETYPNINFYKCNVDESSDLAADFDVGALPTFILINIDDKVINKIEGADLKVLKTAVESLSNLVSTINEKEEGKENLTTEQPLSNVESGLKKCISKACCECTEDCDANQDCNEEECDCKEKTD